jgi:uncharacterized protein
MKIAIISDIHDNLVNLRKCLAWCGKNKIEKMICCGDVTNGETLRILAEEFANEIFLVRGNMEIYKEDEIGIFKNYTYGGPPSPDGFGEASRTAIWEIGGKKIGVCHEPFLIEEVLAKGKCDFIFYGHTHKPWIETKGGVIIANPGTLGGVFAEATFAALDTTSGQLELKLLHRLTAI